MSSESIIPYRTYSDYLKEKYDEKVYKLPVNLPVTCPNRDGKVGVGGCTFCGAMGTGFESLSNQLSVREQLKRNEAHIKKKYKAYKYIAYFQNYSNTYLPIDEFEAYLKEAADTEGIVELCISTRPDCISKEHLEVLARVEKDHAVEISVELGLQTVNYHTLQAINRGHSLAEFIDGVLRIHAYGFPVCTHLILNLPGDNMTDVIENAKVLSALKVEQVKLHALYLMEDTVMGQQYLRGELELVSLEEYKERVITFLEYLDPDIVIQRIIGRAPKDQSLFVNWNQSWWRIRDHIHAMMLDEGRWQGSKWDYLDGRK